MWYTLDGGLNNFTFTENGTIDQNAWNLLSYGPVNIQFYVIDKLGRLGFAEVIIIKELQETEEIPGYNLILLVTSILIVSLIIVKADIHKVLKRKR